MPRRTDSKARMVVAARDLFREHGYVGTALSDVLEASDAPRGSVYFHFPGGKEELGTEVVLAHIADMNSLINHAALRVATRASRATVCSTKMSRGRHNTPAARARADTCIDRMLSPPRSKKESSTPTRSTPSTWA